MTTTNRVLINTFAQYLRTVFNVLLALYSTRIVIETLGVSDYGLYSLIAGVVAMLSFVTNALVISTQRYLSYYHGQNDKKYVSKVFCNSFLIHGVLSLILLVVLISLQGFIVNNVLNIPTNREHAACVVYLIIAIIVSMTLVTSPFRALYVARENIVYISVVDIIDGILKVVAAVCLTLFLYDKLILYAIFLLLISFFDFFAFSIYSWKNYEECVYPKNERIDKKLLKQILGFASWTLYSNGCVVMRTQGVAIVINKFFGVIFNASFGIAQQINGALSSVSQAIANALSPQIIKAEGNDNRDRMLKLAGLESKYASIMLGMVAIPIIFELPFIFKIWLGSIPKSAEVFTRFIIIACLCDQMTAGLGIANQAIGKIRSYSLLFGTVKILTVPFSIIALQIIQNLSVVMFCYLIVELFSSLLRLFFLKRTANLAICKFVKKYMCPALITMLIDVVLCTLIQHTTSWEYRIIIMYPITIIAMSMVVYMSMQKNERVLVNNILLKLKKKI